MTEKSKAKQIAVEETGRVLEETVQKTLENVNRDIDALMGGGAAVIMLNEENGSTYALTRRDIDKIVRFTNDTADPIDVTVPTDAEANIPVYTTVSLMQGANKQVRVVPGNGVLLEAPTGLRTLGQGDMRTLYKRAPMTWVLI